MTHPRFDIVRYEPSMAADWDAAVDKARNSTFLFKRGYVDYHSDRFTDCSWVIIDGKNRIAGLLPCSLHGTQLRSHGGLTYGGFLLNNTITAIDLLGIMDKLIEKVKSIGIKSMIYKPVPHIYHRYPCEEDLYAIFRHGAAINAVNMSSTIEIADKFEFNDNMRRHVNSAKKIGLTIEKSDDLDSFWAILDGLLTERYSTHPVHSLAEIKLLKSRFPENIELWTVKSPNGEVVGGTVVYLTQQVAHTQYIAANKIGKNLNALPFLFYHLINNIYANKRYFDFGISNERHGLYLNEGLCRQKCAMGGRGVAYPEYLLSF